MTFLDDEFARKSLCDWVNQKFALQVKTEDLSEKSPEAVGKFLLERAREAYRRREIEYPVDFILNMSLRHQQAGSSYAAGVIVDWAKDKYGEEMSLDEVRQLSYDKLRQKLLGLSELRNVGDISEEARQRLRSELTELEKYVLLQIYDLTWKDHLYAMDHLKGSIGLRGFAEKDPKIEYKREGYRMFQDMLGNIRDKVTDMIFKAQLSSGQETRSVWNIASTDHSEYSQFEAQQAAGQMPQGQQVVKTIKLEKPKVGRNDACPCGSGKKYKKCCGKNQ
jgi:preprotein translocase subunit SecA